MAKQDDKVGLWIIGACGAVGSTVALGLAAMKRGLTDTTGLVSELPPFVKTGLIDPGTLVLGGHEVRPETLGEAVAGSHARAGLFTPALIHACGPTLRSWQRNVRPGTLRGAGPTVRKLATASFCPTDRTAAAAVERLSADLTAFRRTNRLDHVVVVNAASSEPAPRITNPRASWASHQRSMSRPGTDALPSSALYALAAIEARCAFVNFTPSLGIDVPAIRQRADVAGLPYMGRDGKTGETLVKSVLAPMFAMRHLRVLSWAGQNILGNRDGAVLDDPKTRASKINSKRGTVGKILGYEPASRVSIDYVPSLDDWKVAWDFIHFEGFLGTKMNMQFTWHGSDSALAAPLVIDLARLAALECRRGAVGPMRHLSFFFKDPLDAAEHDLYGQWTHLVRHVAAGVPTT